MMMFKVLSILLLVSVAYCLDYESLPEVIKAFGSEYSDNENETDITTTKRTPMKTPDSVYDPCTMEDGKPGRCVPYYFCLNATTPRKEGVIDIANPEFDGPCKDYLDVCCTPPSQMP